MLVHTLVLDTRAGTSPRAEAAKLGFLTWVVLAMVLAFLVRFLWRVWSEGYRLPCAACIAVLLPRARVLLTPGRMSIHRLVDSAALWVSMQHSFCTLCLYS